MIPILKKKAKTFLNELSRSYKVKKKGKRTRSKREEKRQLPVSVVILNPRYRSSRF